MCAKSLHPSIRNHLAVLAIKDSEFRKALIANPTQAVQNFELPEGISVRVIETEPDTTRILIPRRPSDWPNNLSASEALTRLKGALGRFPAGVSPVADDVLGLIARAMVDKEYAARLVHSPVPVMREAGVVIPDGVKVLVVQEGASECVIIIPSIQPKVAITDAELESTNVLLRDSLMQNEMTMGSWPWHCTNPDTWCPSCLK